MREINYTIDVNGISPSSLQEAGFQSDYNATKVIFTLTDGLLQQLEEQQGTPNWSVEGVNAEGVLSIFPLNFEGSTAQLLLPHQITLPGTTAQLQPVVTMLDDEYNMLSKQYHPVLKVRFGPSVAAMVSKTEQERYSSNLVGAMQVALSSAERAETARDESEVCSARAEQAATSANFSAESAETAAANAVAAAEKTATHIDELKKKWSVIDTITLAEAVRIVDITAPFSETKYMGVIVDIEVAGGGTYASQKARIDIVPNSQVWGINWGVNVLSATPYTKVYYEFQNGAWQGWSQKEVAGSGSTTHTMNNINSIYFADDDLVKKISVYCDNSADKFPAGTKIRLWGLSNVKNL